MREWCFDTMNKGEILDKAEEYFNKEYEDFMRYFDKPIFTEFPNEERAKRALQRALGTAFFLQYLSIPFDEISVIYNGFKEQIESALEKERKNV